MSPIHSSAAPRPAKILLAGVGIVLAAQFFPAIPIAGAIALVAWGTSLAVAHRPTHLLLAAAVYAPLAVIAVSAQIDLAMRSSPAWAVVAAIDATAAIVLLYSLARQTGEIWASE